MKRQRCGESEVCVSPSFFSRDIYHLILSYYLLHTEFSQFELYQLLKYIRPHFVHISFLNQIFDCLSKLLPPIDFSDILLNCHSINYFHHHREDFLYIGKFYKHPSTPHKFIPCYEEDCIRLAAVNNCVLHNHGLITYYGHSVPFKDFVSGFKTEINKWRKKLIHLTF
jgi:hypothetical protein